MSPTIKLRVTALLASFTAAICLIVGVASPANAAAYTKSVYPPDLANSTLTAWADLSLDCSGTYGCWNYMKIERSRWYGVEFIAGKWAPNNGWNSLSTAQPYGCYDYRTTVDSYNDTLISSGVGVNVGVVGVNASGQTIYRFKRTWSSGFKRYCR